MRKQGVSLWRLCLYLFAGLVFAVPTALYAYPHHGKLVNLQQPDGTSVEVKVWGDEQYLRAESVDGYTLIVDPKTKWICYAKNGAEGSLVSSGIHYLGKKRDIDGEGQNIGRNRYENDFEYHGITKQLRESKTRIHARARETAGGLWHGDASAPWNVPGAAAARGAELSAINTSAFSTAPTGTVVGLVVLVDFPDRPANISVNEIYNSFNASSYGDPRGSIRNWSETISGKRVSVQHAVKGYYRARYPTTHYLRGGTWDYSGSDELMAEVYDYIDYYIDLSQLTVFGRALSSLAVLYTGNIVSNGWANSLWPHAGGESYRTSQGIYITHYYMSNLGNYTPLDLETHRHELGHAFFNWPDTYDYDDDSQGAGGYAMETDLPCAPFRMWAGWMNVVDFSASTSARSYSLGANGSTCLRYKNPNNSKEYFVIEYMRKTGWQSNAPDEGLLIWHVDEAGDNSAQNMTSTKHFQLSVEQADGQFQLERNSYSRSGDLFHSGYKTSFDSSTVPNSKWWNGYSSGLRLSNIGGLYSTMDLTVQ